jgi:hypothetical protein
MGWSLWNPINAIDPGIKDWANVPLQKIESTSARQNFNFRNQVMREIFIFNEIKNPNLSAKVN